FKQLDFYRFLTLTLLESIDEETADIIPSGFNNSIRWHLGHIYVSHENLALRFAGVETQIPNTYQELFEGGTKPSEWKQSPPSLTELKHYLSTQPERIRTSLLGKLDQPIVIPFSIPGIVEFNTIGETLNFALYHEGQHTGFIKALVKAVKN
ncbi:MAG: DinB family protein, partial [Bacillota bacterium]|nr:DinB family protein [Bacillota bacterium]